MRNKFEKHLRKTRNLLKTKLCSRNLMIGINHLGRSPCKIFWTILKTDKGKNFEKLTKDKTEEVAQGLLFESSY